MHDFDLKSFRENSLKMTQAELANLIGVRQDTVSRMEKNPDQISLTLLINIAEKTGLTLDQLVSYKKPIVKALEVSRTWSNAKYVKSTIIDYLASYSEELKGSRYNGDIEKLQEIVDEYIRKPKVIFIGRSDSGKSTMINALIGRNLMPTNWTPTTSIVVYIKHIEDRPDFIKDDLIIFKKGEPTVKWDDTKINEEAYCNEWKLASGNAELLSSYGVRRGDKFDENSIGAAILFADSDILKNCDLIDVPGFTGGIESDNITARNIQSQADVLVYLSQAGGGFMSVEDCVYLKEGINKLAVIEDNNYIEIDPLSNLFVVATQAHIVDSGNPQKLNEIMCDGADRFCRTLPDKFWESRSLSNAEISKEDFRKRFFSYTTDIPNVRFRFENEFSSIIEKLPDIIKMKTIDLIGHYCEEQKLNLSRDVDKYQKLIEEREKYVDLINEIKRNEPVRKAKANEKKVDILDSINKYNAQSKEEFEDGYQNIFNIEHIIQIIDEKKFKSKKEDMQLLSSYLNSELESEVNKILKNKSELLSKKIDEYLKTFENKGNIDGVKSISTDMLKFNAKRAFASGLAGLAAFGGLAFWASTLGNLGGYILVAKGVSLLSALGISVGGTAAAVSFVASIGGPVVLGVALAVIAALSIYGIFTGNWKKKAAKNIIKAYNEQDAILKYKANIEKFWKDTEVAFVKAVHEVETQWKNHIDDLYKEINSYSLAELYNGLKDAKKTVDFFTNIPF